MFLNSQIKRMITMPIKHPRNKPVPQILTCISSFLCLAVATPGLDGPARPKRREPGGGDS